MLAWARVQDIIEYVCVPVTRGAANKVAAVLVQADYATVVRRAGGGC